MDYIIYCAHTKDGDIYNMTCNPAVDLAFYRNKHGINRIEVLTQDLDISYADYIIRSMDKEYSPVQKVLMRSSSKNELMRDQYIKKAMARLGIKPPRKPLAIDIAGKLPGEESLDTVHSLLRGRILSSSELNKIIDNRGIFLEESIDDIMQTLYLMGRVQVFPWVEIDRPHKRYICTLCRREISQGELDMDQKCAGCGYHLHMDEPVFASPYDGEKKNKTPVKFKEYKGLSFPQDRGSMDLCRFLESDREECLLWMVPGSEDANITSRAARDILNRGGRIAVAASCQREMEEYRGSLTDTFPNTSCVFHEGGDAAGNWDIVIMGMEDIKRYYKAFDLIIISEASECPKGPVNYTGIQVKRALKDRGKIVYATSTPDFRMYKRVLKGDISLVAVPLRSHGMLCPEPRIMTYKALSYDNLFIPSGVMEYIVWSAEEGVRIHILVPYRELIEQVRELLINSSDIKTEWLLDTNPLILVTAMPYDQKHDEEEENIIVFLADENRVFDERALIGCAGLSGRVGSHRPGEVLFVASEENDEIYNARHMMRFINKSAWEMGYLK